MRITNDGLVLEGVFGAQPELFYGTAAPDGDANPWLAKAIGSKYIRTSAGFVAEYMKLQNNGANADWVLLQGCVIDTIALADMTDGGAAIASFVMTGDIPIGAEVSRTDLRSITGWAGDTSATIQVGDGTDVDRYTTGTPSIFATAEMVDAGAVSGTAIHVSAVSPVVTITSGSEWGSVTAGSVTVAIWFNGVV